MGRTAIHGNDGSFLLFDQTCRFNVRPTGRQLRLHSIPAAICLTVTMVLPLAAGTARFLTPQELAELGDKSEVSYGTTIVDSPADLPPVLHPGFPEDAESLRLTFPRVLEGADGGRSLTAVEFPSSTAKALTQGESLFDNREYDKARVVYESALTADPKSSVLHSHIGDCYLLSGRPSEALKFYDESVTLNLSDYRGHWYRASALFELGRYDEAHRAYSQALAKAPRYQPILDVVRSRSAKLRLQVHGTVFEPKAISRREGDVYQIYTNDKTYWWLYGLCKAVWLAEEDHRRELTGESEHTWTSTEELECLGVLLARYKSERDSGETEPEAQLDTLLGVLNEKLLGAFVFYEFGSRVTPHFSILLPPESQARIVQYVAEYVLSPAAHRGSGLTQP